MFGFDATVTLIALYELKIRKDHILNFKQMNWAWKSRWYSNLIRRQKLPKIQNGGDGGSILGEKK
jgi:hypothetical protein